MKKLIPSKFGLTDAQAAGFFGGNSAKLLGLRADGSLRPRNLDGSFVTA